MLMRKKSVFFSIWMDALWMSAKFICLIMSFSSKMSLFRFCVNDPLIGENEIMMSTTITVLESM